MQQAQLAKVRRALRMVDVKPGERVLEIGCGWGALAEMATTEFGARLVGVTLSTEQLAWARARMSRCGVAERADLRLQDYRDIGRDGLADQSFDAICSIEMIEAVGREYWPTYFATVARLLKTGGRACIQSTCNRPTSFSSTSFRAAACPARALSGRKPSRLGLR
jgi:cyclopropane-fatty-acyl-phospholipid synthase